VFLDSSSAIGVLRHVLQAADASGPAPSDQDIAADVEDFDMTPLFDGAALERI
jgi:hypothetical protein